MTRSERFFITHCINLAGAAPGEVPVGAIVVHEDRIVAEATNAVEAGRDATAHAEILAIRAASRTLGRKWLEDCTLYVTLEPCAMCAGAIYLARLGRVVFGAWEPKFGAFGSRLDLRDARGLNHQVEVRGGVMADECGAQLRAFFADKR